MGLWPALTPVAGALKEGPWMANKRLSLGFTVSSKDVLSGQIIQHTFFREREKAEAGGSTHERPQASSFPHHLTAEERKPGLAQAHWDEGAQQTVPRLILGTSPAGTPAWLGCPPSNPVCLIFSKEPPWTRKRQLEITSFQILKMRLLRVAELGRKGNICVSPLHPSGFLNLVAKEVLRTCRLFSDASFTSPEPEPNSISPTSGESSCPEPSPLLSGGSLGT